jgi:hypothetical protein
LKEGIIEELKQKIEIPSVRKGMINPGEIYYDPWS